MTQEETSVEDTVTVSLGEYQMMKEALEGIERKRTPKVKEKRWLRALSQHSVAFLRNFEAAYSNNADLL